MKSQGELWITTEDSVGAVRWHRRWRLVGSWVVPGIQGRSSSPQLPPCPHPGEEGPSWSQGLVFEDTKAHTETPSCPGQHKSGPQFAPTALWSCWKKTRVPQPSSYGISELFTPAMSPPAQRHLRGASQRESLVWFPPRGLQLSSRQRVQILGL